MVGCCSISELISCYNSQASPLPPKKMDIASPAPPLKLIVYMIHPFPQSDTDAFDSSFNLFKSSRLPISKKKRA